VQFQDWRHSHSYSRRYVPELLFPTDDEKKRKSYFGQLHNGTPIGHGTMTWKDGQIYTGTKNMKRFFLGFVPSQLTSLQFILYHVLVFYKPATPQSPPPNLQDYSICNNARFEFSTNFIQSFHPNEWCLKIDGLSGGSNSQTFGCESSAFATRPLLLA
jgi:hypothetical protein